MISKSFATQILNNIVNGQQIIQRGYIYLGLSATAPLEDGTINTEALAKRSIDGQQEVETGYGRVWIGGSSNAGSVIDDPFSVASANEIVNDKEIQMPTALYSWLPDDQEKLRYFFLASSENKDDAKTTAKAFAWGGIGKFTDGAYEGVTIAPTGPENCIVPVFPKGQLKITIS